MPKTKPVAGNPKQVTISKFFTSSKQPAAIQVLTDDDDKASESSVTEPSKKRKLTTKQISNKNKRHCLNSSTLSKDNVWDCSASKPFTVVPSTVEESSTTDRLRAFEFLENSKQNERTENKIWQPKNMPDILSPNDSTQVNSSDVMSDDSSDDESPSGSFVSRTNHAAGKSSSTALLHKFSAGRSGPPSGKKGPVKYTPLEQQYMEIKEKYPDALLLVECGYKYRFFGKDAEIAAEVLKIQCHPDHSFMTASIPVHRLFVHVRRLVSAGHKVGVVKQTETAALKAASDKRSAPFGRKLSALYTKSTLIGEDPQSDNIETESSELGSVSTIRPHSYLMCVYDFPSDGSTKTHQIGMLAVDPGTGDMVYDCFHDGERRHELETRLCQLEPVEVLLPATPTDHTHYLIYGLAALSSRDDDRMRIEHISDSILSYANAFEAVSGFFSSRKDSEKLQFVLSLPKPVLCCLAGLISYLTDFNLHSLLLLTSNLHEFSTKSKLVHLPAACLRNLEIFQNGTDGTERGSLFWILNHTVTHAGARLLRSWITQPSRDVLVIRDRHDAVQELLSGFCPGLLKMRELMARLPDLEKGLCSIYHRKVSAQEFVLVSRALTRCNNELKTLQRTELTKLTSALLRHVVLDVPDLLEDVDQFLSSINEKAAKENDKANLFSDEKRYCQVAETKKEIRLVEQELKDYRKEIRLVLRQPSLDYVSILQTEYLVEVKNTLLKTVPKEWTQISSTKTVSRFHPTFVVERYRRLCQLREQLLIDVARAWEQFLGEFSDGFLRYRKSVQLLASLDVLLALAQVAKQDGYCRPEMVEDGIIIEIEDGRHPVIDAFKREQEQYVPNSTHLSSSGQRVMIVTGPNMGGKSSYIRQVALIAVMAQIGSFVPAASARLGILDAVFTRMGAEDEIFRGRSTFMVELQEAGEIMAAGTEHSLVIIDELGRGTSTHDGVAIAYATLEYFITKMKSLLLFVTHYPILAQFQTSYPGVVGNYHMSFFLYNTDEDSNDKDTKPLEQGSETELCPKQKKDEEDMITFLYQLMEGAAAKSYGLNVARLAHIPPDILHKAAFKSRQLEEEILKRSTDHQDFVKIYFSPEDGIRASL